MKARGWTLTLCSVVLLGMAGLAFFAPAESLATCDSCEACPSHNCGWYSDPQSTQADETGFFDTATDGDDFVLQWRTARVTAEATRDLAGNRAIWEVGDSVSGTVFVSSDPSHSSVGLNYANLGDVNGDGRDDLAVSAPSSLVRGKKAGALFVLLDTRDLPARVDLADVGVTIPGFRMHGTVFAQTPDGVVENSLSSFGNGLDAIGDFDGDGLDDFVVTGTGVESIYLVRGRVYIIYAPGANRAALSFVDITPDFGTLRGGTAVVLRGAGFTEPAELRFGDAPASAVEVVSSSEIRALSPPASRPGAVDLLLASGGATLTIPGGFEYVEPFPEFDLADLGSAGFTVLSDGLRRVGESAALGDITGDGASELVVSLWPEDTTNTWLAAVIHGGQRRAGEIDLSAPAPGPIDPPGSVYLLWGAREPPERVELAKLRGRGLRLEGTIPTGNAEVPVRETGDFDGDGITDIAFSQRGLTDTRGRVHLIYGVSPSVEFLRGDADTDGTVNLTDAVYVLSYLFLTGTVPPCQDAADVDDLGAVELTDAVYSGPGDPPGSAPCLPPSQLDGAPRDSRHPRGAPHSRIAYNLVHVRESRLDSPRRRPHPHRASGRGCG